MAEADYLLALKLQREFDQELQEVEKKPEVKRKVEVKTDAEDKWSHRQSNLDCTQNLVHPEWETLDPTPDVQALFLAFDNKFFQGRLECVTLEWSKRMYSCAGICYSRRNHLGMAITIRLSEPLLKLRSRKDLVETLLHEMIHAYCSVLGIREGNGGHGPNFQKIMHGINKVAGTNITVYHTFHDEVDTYKTHWWRCNGICQNRKPFFGYVKRTSNRAPGPNDIWWRNHLESCGGTFLKIREPERKKPKTEKENKMKTVKSTKDIRTFFGNQNKKTAPAKGSVKSNGGGTIVINEDASSTPVKPLTSTPAKAYPGSVNNVVGFKDLNGARQPQNIPGSTKAIVGAGYSLNSANSSTGLFPPPSSSQIDRDRIRNIWASKFPDNSAKRPIEINGSDQLTEGAERKRLKIDSEPETQRDNSTSIAPIDDFWTEIDEEVMLKEPKQDIINISSDDDDDDSSETSTKSPTPAVKPTAKLTSAERQQQIKQEIMESSDCLFSEDEIELIDDEYNDDIISTNGELADTSLIDDLFGEDTLLRDFKKQNSVVASNSRYHSDPKNDIVSCPVCQDGVTREFFSEHLDGCIGISVKVVAPTSKPKAVPFYKRKDKKSGTVLTPDAVKRALKDAGYGDNEIADVVDTDFDDLPSEESPNRRRGLDTSTHACPVCGIEVDVNRINEHLDVCLPGH